MNYPPSVRFFAIGVVSNRRLSAGGSRFLSAYGIPARKMGADTGETLEAADTPEIAERLESYPIGHRVSMVNIENRMLTMLSG